MQTNLEGAHEGIINTHHCTSIVELSAVVGCRKESDKLSFCIELVSVLYNLMCTTDQVKIVFVQEFRHYVRSKGVRNSTVVLTPARYFLVGV